VEASRRQKVRNASSLINGRVVTRRWHPAVVASTLAVRRLRILQ
jgi:hypothetical protein